jgi:large subunit ribosomal protein L19
MLPWALARHAVPWTGPSRALRVPVLSFSSVAGGALPQPVEVRSQPIPVVTEPTPDVRVPVHKLFDFPRVPRQMRAKGALTLLKREYRNLLRSKQRRIDNFKAGDHIGVKVYATSLDKEKFRVINGVCLARKNRGLDSGFKVRTVVMEEQVEFHFPLHSPWIQEVRLLKALNPKKNKLYGMRDAPNAYFAVEQWDGVHEPGAGAKARARLTTGGMELDEDGNPIPKTKRQRWLLAQGKVKLPSRLQLEPQPGQQAGRAATAPSAAAKSS